MNFIKLKINKLIYLFILFSFLFVSTSYAMEDFYGELEYNGTTNITRCTCRYNTSQFTNNSNIVEENWLPNIVTGFGITILTDLMRYDFQTNEYKSFIYNCCILAVPFCYDNLCKPCPTRCGICLNATRRHCEQCSKCCKDDEEEPGVGKP